MSHDQLDEGGQEVWQMQKVVHRLEGLLWATGGALVPDKCFWYLVDFEYANNKWKDK